MKTRTSSAGDLPGCRWRAQVRLYTARAAGRAAHRQPVGGAGAAAVVRRRGGSDAPPAAADALSTRTTYVAPDFETFSEILERPLFTKGRTPPEPPTPEQAAVLNPGMQAQLTMRLEGIALTPEARIAVVRDITSNTLLRLAEGATYQGWVVESVNATSATLKRGEQSHELTLELNEKSLKRTPSPVMKPRSPVRKNRKKK